MGSNWTWENGPAVLLLTCTCQQPLCGSPRGDVRHICAEDGCDQLWLVRVGDALERPLVFANVEEHGWQADVLNAARPGRHTFEHV